MTNSFSYWYWLAYVKLEIGILIDQELKKICRLRLRLRRFISRRRFQSNKLFIILLFLYKNYFIFFRISARLEQRSDLSSTNCVKQLLGRIRKVMLKKLTINTASAAYFLHLIMLGHITIVAALLWERIIWFTLLFNHLDFRFNIQVWA